MSITSITNQFCLGLRWLPKGRDEMGDIVQRLQAWVGVHGGKLPPERGVRNDMLTDAIAEIDRLRTENEALRKRFDRAPES